MTNRKIDASVVALAVVALIAGSCGGKQDTGPTTTDKEPAKGGEGGGVVTEAPDLNIPTQGDAADHYLGHGNLFAGPGSYSHGSAYVEPVVQLAAKDDTGEGTFYVFRTGKEIRTAHFWQTHKASKDELKVGVVALMLNKKDGQGIYMAPQTVQMAYEEGWWLARIASIAPLENKGFVWVAGGYKVAADAIRILDGDESPSLTIEGDEDAHFIQSGLWVAGNAGLSDTSYIYVSISAMARDFDGGEARFVALHNGSIFDTSHAWQTEIADADDIKVGVQVMLPDIKDGSIYRAPATRKEALFNRWWIVKITEVKKDTVIVNGGYEVKKDALRVIQ